MTILVIELNRRSPGNFLSFLSSIVKFKQPAKKKTRMDGEHNRITGFRRVIITRINRNAQPIVLEQWERTYQKLLWSSGSAHFTIQIKRRPYPRRRLI